MARDSYGTGSMVERAPGSGVWRLRAMGPEGRRETTFRGTEAAARKALRAFGEKLALGRVVDPDERTVGQLLDEWVAFKTPRWAPKTLDEAKREVENRIRPELGHVRLSALTPKMLDDAYSKWLTEVSASSVHRHAATISSALSQGVKWGWIDINPAARASAPTAKTDRKLVHLQPDQVATLIKTAKATDPVMAVAIRIAFITGARRGELCALHWSDIDLEVGILRIERSLTQVGETLTVKDTKTGRGRNVALDARTVAALRRHREWQENLAHEAESPIVTDPYVLSDNANGARPIDPSKITDRFTSLRGRSGVHRVRFHDLRHAHVSQLLGAGVDATTVANRVGHASTRMTLDQYAHALPQGDVVAASLIEDLLPE
jgi:integrase